jgi:hypothetical protein
MEEMETQISQAAKYLLLAGKDLVPIKLEYSSEDIVDQICYMMTFGDDDSVLEIPYESVPKPLKKLMVMMLEDARQRVN